MKIYLNMEHNFKNILDYLDKEDIEDILEYYEFPKSGKKEKLVLGNLDAKRDWGHAKDYVEGMYNMLQQDTPDDYVLATNEFHSVREFVEESFGLKGFDIKWKGEGVDEIGYDKNTGKELVFVSEKYFRPAEVEELLGDASKARKELCWVPKIGFKELVKKMVESDCL